MGIRKRRQNLKKILEQYVEEDLKLYEKYEKMPPHTFSDEYRQNMENLVKQSVRQRKHAFVYRLAMVGVCVIMALLIVNQASAYVFGMTLWDKLTEPAPKEMVTTVYQGKEDSRTRKGGDKAAEKERVHDIPTEIPEGYELVSEKNNNNGISAQWQLGDNGSLIFNSFGINQDVHISENEDWEIEEAVALAGYQGEFYVRSEYSCLYWDDEEYHNSLIASNMSKEQLFVMAESLYQK